MHKQLFTLLLLLLTAGVYAQQVIEPHYADSVIFKSKTGKTEIVYKHKTDSVPGFIFNAGGGRFIFKRGLTRLNDSTYVIGADTLKVKASAALPDLTPYYKRTQVDSTVAANKPNLSVYYNRTQVDSLVAGGGDSTYVVPYSTLLRFNKKKMSLPHTQAGVESFSLGIDSAEVGKMIRLTVIGNGDSLKFPANFIWKHNILPQFDKTNDFTFIYRADGNVDAEVSTRDANYSNLIPITGQTSFLTYAGYQWTDWNIQPDSDVIVYAGTIPGGNDIMLPEQIQGGINTTLHPNIRFDTPTLVYLTGVPPTAIQSINNSGLNKY